MLYFAILTAIIRALVLVFRNNQLISNKNRTNNVSQFKIWLKRLLLFVRYFSKREKQQFVSPVSLELKNLADNADKISAISQINKFNQVNYNHDLHNHDLHSKSKHFFLIFIELTTRFHKYFKYQSTKFFPVPKQEKKSG